MTVTKFIKTPKLFEYLDLEVSEALHRHGIRDLFDYAWASEDTPSDEFIGLAMWSSEHSSPFQYGCRAPSGYSREEYDRLITTCEDLESLMQLARLAIGHTLWMSDLIKSQSIFFSHDHHFWLNHINSVTLLGMASDRLRDLFLAAYFRTTFEQYASSNQNRVIDSGRLKSGFYQYSFADASIAPRLPTIATNLLELSNLAGKIYESRKSRNAIVHDLATKAAKFMKEFLAADSPGLVPFNATSHKEVVEKSEMVHEANMAELDDAIRFVTDWYRDLVKATSITFEVEYVLTRNAASC